MFGRGKRNILAIGSVHLDTIAERHFETGRDPIILEAGKIVHAIGGSAYNIAANLSRHDHDEVFNVGIYTILPKYSMLTQIFEYKMDESEVGRKFITKCLEINGVKVRGGGYVGIMDRSTSILRMAVIDAALHDTDVFSKPQEYRGAKKALTWSDVIVVHSDLSPHTLQHVAEHSKKTQKPLFISLGSRGDAQSGWLSSSVDCHAVGVSGRLELLRGLLAGSGSHVGSQLDYFMQTGEADRIDAKELCGVFRAGHIVCTDPVKGVALLNSRSGVHFVRADPLVRERAKNWNMSGVADAAFAGFIATYLRTKSDNGENALSESTLDLQNAAIQDLVGRNITDYMKAIATCEGATPGAVISFEEQEGSHSKGSMFVRAMRMALDAVPVHKYVGYVIAALLATAVVEYVLSSFGIEILDWWKKFPVKFPK